MNSRIIHFKRHKQISTLLKLITIVVILLLAVDFLTLHLVNTDRYIEAMYSLSENKTVIIDAGHGGEDPGTIGINGVYEKDLNLQISYLLGAALAERGYAVFYTRTEDKLLYSDEENIKGIRKISDLKNRCKIAAEFPNAILISIHMNSYKKEKYHGLQVYYRENDNNSRMLADEIQKSVIANMQPENNRKTKPGKDIYLLENSINTSVLIECGFLSNKEECENLSKKEYQSRLCLSIVYGIIEYIENYTQKM